MTCTVHLIVLWPILIMSVWLLLWGTKALFNSRLNRALLNCFFLVYFPLTGSARLQPLSAYKRLYAIPIRLLHDSYPPPALEEGDIDAIRPLIQQHLLGGVKRLGSLIFTELKDYFAPLEN